MLTSIDSHKRCITCLEVGEDRVMLVLMFNKTVSGILVSSAGYLLTSWISPPAMNHFWYLCRLLCLCALYKEVSSDSEN